MIPSVYINLEDDVTKVVARLKKTKSPHLILVCPKRCQLFSDSINLRLLKKQTDLLKKEVYILTMDERGQLYAKEAGFGLKFLPKSNKNKSFSDIHIQEKQTESGIKDENALQQTVKNVSNFVTQLVAKKPPVKKSEQPIEYESQTVFNDQVLPAMVASGYKPKTVIKSPTVIKKLRLSVDRSSFGQQDAVSDLKPKKHSRRNWALSLLLPLCLLIVLGLVFVVLPAATVVAYPKSEPVTRDFDISLDTAADKFDPNRLILPAEKIERTIEVKDRFKSVGKKDVGGKATGKIRIYNFTGQTLNLKASTTSLSAGSKTYALSQDAQQIKPTKYKNAQTKVIDEESLNEPFDVIATAGGEDSNLPAGTRMEITNQVFGSRPQVLYAKTEVAVGGGTTRFLSVVSESDIQAAQSELGNKALEKLGKELQGKNLHLAENAYRTEVVSFTTDKAAGTESPNFDAVLQIKVIGLAFSDSQLRDLVKERISQTLSQDRYLKTQGDFNLNYKAKSVDLNIPAAVFGVHFEGKTIMRVDVSHLPSALAGKSREQAGEIVKSVEGISQADITLSPSWQRNFPWFSGKINVRVSE